MQYPRVRSWSSKWVGLALSAATLAALSACDPKPSNPPTPTAEAAPSPSTSAGPASGAQPGVKPVDEAHAASSAGPSDGTTAIGGVAGPGGHTGSDTPAPTAGDGAASAASR